MAADESRSARRRSEDTGRPLAHVRIEPATLAPVEHDLVEHLKSVSALAAQFAAEFGPEWARLAGLWHDLGKFRAGFQIYIRSVNGLDAHIEGKWSSGSDKTHSAAGALHAMHELEARFGPDGRMLARVFAFIIAGHHAGLADWIGGLDARLSGTGAADSRREHDEALAAANGYAPGLFPLPPTFDLRTEASRIPGLSSGNPLAVSFWIRMLFSTLCDADFLDTERFMDLERADRRLGYPTIRSYRQALDAHLDTLERQVEGAGRQGDVVMRARAQVLELCRSKAPCRPGVFTLTVPTGGGKTLSSLAFALRHAETHGLRRVVYAIPYTSIIEQTADVFSGIFGEENVVEHHSQGEAAPGGETPRSRLACENWDAPLIVTTNVQLFESLFASRTSRCRKLHRLANSVIVLDEAQLLPPPYLQPILDALRLLVEHYGVSVVLCTATQPVLTDLPRFDPRASLRGLPTPHPIVEAPEVLFRQLSRVRVEWPADLVTPATTASLVSRLVEETCVLVVVNTRKDAAELVSALDAATGDRTIHLSAAMCGQHRADVIRDIRRRLAGRRAGDDATPLRVVSTQLVEAGVDIDFPVVYRAFTGLDSIAQAAGRCNREGLLGPDGGRLVIFVREIPRTLAALRFGVQAARTTLSAAASDLGDPSIFADYFPRYYDQFPSRDHKGIVEALRNDGSNGLLAFGFRTAAENFRLVDDDSVPVIVPYVPSAPGARNPKPLIAQLRSGESDRWLMRALQRFTVNVRRQEVTAWQARGDVSEVQPGTFVLSDPLRYDERLGMLPDGALPAPEALVA